MVFCFPDYFSFPSLLQGAIPNTQALRQGRVNLAAPSIEFITRHDFAQTVGVYCTTSSRTHAFVVVC